MMPDHSFSLATQPVLCLNTGGTISSFDGPDGPEPRKGDFGAVLLQKYKSVTTHALSNDPPSLPGCDFQGLFCIDSDGVTQTPLALYEYHRFIESPEVRMEDWFQLALLIQNNLDLFTGFIILHGTDTLAYTSSMLSYLLSSSPAASSGRVVVTGAQIPLSFPDSDGWLNIQDAYKVASGKVVCEETVVVCFKGKTFRGSSVTKSDSKSLNAFSAPNIGAVTTMVRTSSPRSDKFVQIVNDTLKPWPKSPRVEILYIYPGLRKEIVEQLVDSISSYPHQGLLVLAFGAGNISKQDDGPLNAFKKAIKKGVWVVVGSQCLAGDVKPYYPLGRNLSSLGVDMNGQLTVEATLTKMLWVLGEEQLYHHSEGEKESKQIWRRKLFHEDIAGEWQSAS